MSNGISGILLIFFATDGIKTTTTKKTTTETNDNNGNDNDKKKNDDDTKSDRNNDPCNYYGLDVCDNDRKGCDGNNFDCLTDDCNDGRAGTTGTCDGDDDKICWRNGEYLDKCYPAPK